jgi:hypothetical protein
MISDSIPCTTIATFERSGCSLVVTEAGGSGPAGISKGGAPVSQSFGVGAIALVDQDFKCLVAPIDISAAAQLASRIIDGDPRARTEPASDLILASALLALIVTNFEVDPGSSSVDDPDVTG